MEETITRALGFNKQELSTKVLYGDKEVAINDLLKGALRFSKKQHDISLFEASFKALWRLLHEEIDACYLWGKDGVFVKVSRIGN